MQMVLFTGFNYTAVVLIRWLLPPAAIMCQDSRRKLLVTDHVNRKENPSTQAESVIMCAAVCISKDLSVLFRRLVLSRQVMLITTLLLSLHNSTAVFICFWRLQSENVLWMGAAMFTVCIHSISAVNPRACFYYYENEWIVLVRSFSAFFGILF